MTTNRFSAFVKAYYFYYERLSKYRKFLVWLSLVACLLATWIVFAGLSETQRFSLSQAPDLGTDPAMFNRQHSFNLLGSYPPLVRILFHMDAVRFQVWIAAGLVIRFCGLLIKTKRGLLMAQLGLLFSTAIMFKYLSWSLSLLSCDSCLQKGFLLAVPPGLSYPYVLFLLSLLAMEVGLLIGFVFAYFRSQVKH